MKRLSATVRRKALLVSAACVCAGGLLHGADYQSTVLSDNPAGYWRLNESPVTLGDIQVTNLGTAGSAANGVFDGYVQRQQQGALPGSADTASRFWGNIAENSRITIGSKETFNFTGTTPFTLEIWAKPMMVLPTGTTTATAPQRLISNGSGANGYSFSIRNFNSLRVTGWGVADVTSDLYSPTFASNQWYHLVLVRSNTLVYFYVNGVQLGAPKTLNNIQNSTNALAIGRNPQGTGSEPFTGVLDEPAVYGGLLTAEQIAAHYDTGINNSSGYQALITSRNPIGYWRLNEPSKVESTSTIANSGSAGAAAQGSVFGGLNSVIGGAPGAIAADPNPSLNFPGPDGRIDVPFNPALNTPSYTVECWARMDSWANGHLSPLTSRESGASGTRGFIVYAAPVSASGNRPRWEFWSGTGTAFNTVNAGEPDVVTNKWTHLVGTYDAETKVMALYVDGTLARGLANVTHGPNIATPLRIGAGSSELKNGQYHWRGGVDEVAIYPGALSPQRVQAHYQAATGVNPALVSAPGAQIEPLGQTNWAPYPVTVSCVVTGSLPMTFQWYKVSPDMTVTNLVPNATNMVLQLANTSPAQDGYYYLAATNGLGGTETAWAYVEIRPLTSPVLTLNSPASVPVYANGTAGIPALADGTPVIGYQWQSNNVNIASATNPVLQVPQVQPSFSTATYKVLATNFVGATVGDPAQLSVLTPPPATYAAVITGFNPLAYWRFGETGGAYAFDYWGGHPAVYSNAFPASLPGALLDNDDGGVTAFGAGSFVQTVEVAPFNFTGTQPFTLATWVKVDAFPPSGVGRIFSNRKQLGGAGGYGIGFLGNNTLRFTGFGVADVNASVPSFTAGQWYHIAAVRSNTTVYLYIDGVLKNSGTVANINPSIYPLRLAGNANFTTVGDEEAFNGTLDEAAVFSRDLSAAEISALYAARYGSLNPPTITREPNPSVTLVGGTARFDVQAGGSQPLGYVWRANGSPIAGATNASLVLSNVTAGLNGINYTVTITNSAGTITSVAALLTVQQAAAYSAAVVADNPVAFWRLNESFGPVVHDVWGGYNGLDSSTVVYNAPGALAGTPDTAATFDGMSSKVDVAYNPALNPPSFTFEAWARVTGGQGTYRCVMATRDEVLGDNQKGAIIYATAGNIWSFWTSVGSGWQTVDGPAVVLDKWTHLAAVYDGTTKSFYVDGVLAGSAIIQAVPNIVRPLRIGAGRNELDTGDYWFYGDIDEVALYNKGLTADRVAYHYEYGKYGPNAAPVILRQPSSLSVVEGNDPVFRVQAGGTPTLGYQWLFNNTAISGATASVLTIENAYYTDAGSYKVRITNALGSVESLPATLTVGAPPSYAYLTNQLVLHLKFENNAQDSSGRGNHGTELGAPTYVPGRLGQALHYNTDAGATTFNYVTLGQPADLLFSSNVNFSVSYWVRFTGTPNDLPFICNALNSYGNSGLTFAPGYGTGTWSWSAVGTTANVSTGYGTQQINDGQWHHLVHTFDRTGAALTFLDGQLADSRWFDTVGDVDTAFPINIGQDPTGVYAENGAADIDDIAIWRKALTPYDAQSIYAAAANNQSIDTVGPVQLRISQAGLDIELIWQSGTLQEATQVNGTYTPVQGATAPYFRIPVGTGAKFYRIRP